MVIAKPKGKHTYADYAALPDDNGRRWELIDGVLYQMAAGASSRHQEVSENLGRLMWNCILPDDLGRIYRPRFDLILPGESAVEPDLMYIRTTRLPIIITGRGCEGPPDLVVEILSPSNPSHDLAVKRELYARHGIPEYWILEPFQETLRAHTEPTARGGVGRLRRQQGVSSWRHPRDSCYPRFGDCGGRHFRRPDSADCIGAGIYPPLANPPERRRRPTPWLPLWRVWRCQSPAPGCCAAPARSGQTQSGRNRARR